MSTLHSVHNAPWSDCRNKNVFSDRLNQELPLCKSDGKLFSTFVAADVRWTLDSQRPGVGGTQLIIIIIKRQFIRHSNMASVTTRASCLARASVTIIGKV